MQVNVQYVHSQGEMMVVNIAVANRLPRPITVQYSVAVDQNSIYTPEFYFSISVTPHLSKARCIEINASYANSVAYIQATALA